MTEAEIKNSLATYGKPVSEPEISLKPWFCVAISSTSAMFKGDFETPAEILNTAEKASIAWIDYVAQDFDKEGIEIQYPVRKLSLTDNSANLIHDNMGHKN